MLNIDNKLLILVVGDIARWRNAGRELPQIAHTEFCAFADLTSEFLSRLQPDIILSPLVTAGFDVMDLAITLDNLDYEGRVRAISPPLPNPDLILSEVRFECPALDFDLIQIRPGPKLRCV